MSWSSTKLARDLKRSWPTIIAMARQSGAVRVILVQPPAGRPRFEAHLDTDGPLPPPRPLDLPGLRKVALTYVRGGQLRSRSPAPPSNLLTTQTTKSKAGSTLMQKSGTDFGNFGTAGWNFRMGTDDYVLGNRHVLRSLPLDDAPLHPGASSTAPAIADLRYYEEISDSAVNVWDLAIARFRQPSVAVDTYAFGAPDYPRTLATRAPVLGEQHYKVGATTQKTTGTYYGRGVEIAFDVFSDEVYYTFSEQLYFKMVADGGDSGSVVVRASGNVLVGLLMGIVPGHQLVVANPLYMYGLTIISPGSDGQLPVVKLGPRKSRKEV